VTALIQRANTTSLADIDPGRMRMKHLLPVLAAGCATLLGATAHADTYPSKPITIVVPFGPGSATDTIARVAGQQLSVALKQSVVIEDRPGANGTLAGLYVARSAPDGYTLFMGTNSSHSAAPFLMRNVAYDPVKNFTAVTRMGSYTQVLVTHPSIPAKSVKELIAYVKTNPGKLSFASGHTSGLVAGQTFKHWAGLDMLHVPYKSSPLALNDVLAGRVSMVFTDLVTGIPHVKAGTLRALATSRLQRSALLPDLPTLDEEGVTGFDMDSWAAFFAPAGTPADIVAQLNRELRKIIDSQEVKSKLGNAGFEAFSSSPEELAEFVKAQLVKWGKMIKDAGIEPE
jgi:tripartite-type tricarboxylate transporter receptor subunit TctC